MTTSWLLAVLATSLAGFWLWRFDPLPRLDLPARLSIAFVAGSVGVTLVMFLASVAGLAWHPLWIGGLIVASALFVRRATPVAGARRGSSIAIGFFAAVTLYGTLTARETCADLIYFWGTKALRFARFGGIDLAFLAAPEHFLMHPDYPPLVPLLYGWGAMIAGAFPLWGPLALTAFLLAATGFIVRGLGETHSRDARIASVLLTAALAYGYAQGLAAGAADPVLILYEVAALAAITFAGHTRGGALLASLALTGAAMTKVEGTAFVAIVLASHLLARRDPMRTAAIAALPIASIASWIGWMRMHGLLDSYARGGTQLHLDALPGVAAALTKAASYHARFLPWIALIVPLALGWRYLRNAAIPLLTAAGSLAAAIYFYLHSADATTWIIWSGERVLLTPLAALGVAVAAASPSRSAEGTPEDEAAQPKKLSRTGDYGFLRSL